MNRTQASAHARIALLLLAKSTLRHWVRARWSYILIIAIVAVGVGSLNGIRQASRAATANFGLFNEAVSGRSDFLIQAPVGPLDERALPRLNPLTRSVQWHLFPVVEGPLTQLAETREPVRQLRLVGLDLVSIANLPQFIEQDFSLGGEDEDWHDWIGEAKRVWVSAQLLETAELSIGDTLTASVAGQVHQLAIAGSLGGAERPVPEDLIVADLPAAQRILSRPGEVDRVEVIIDDRSIAADPRAIAEIEKELRAGLPEAFELKPAAERAAERAGMTAAFRLNLTILSLIAMLVGVYLILQALDAAVVRRRNELATLKSLGVTGSAILLCLLFEAGLIGLLGSSLGIGVGILLASGAVHIIADTVNALYFATSVEAIRLRPSDLWLGFGIGFVFSLLAGWLPARDAMSTPPAQILSRGDWSPGFSWLRSRWPGAILLALGFACLALPSPVLPSGSQVPIGGFLAAGCWIFGAALLSGGLMSGLASLLRGVPCGPGVRLAISRLADGSSRHRLAVAGLVVAVSMVTGMLQMVGSFRDTIERWFDVRFQADLYVSERGSGGAASFNGIDPAVMQELTRDEAVAYADTLYVSYVEAPRGKTVLAGIDFEAWQSRIDQIWQARPGELEPVSGAQPALVSETFARRFDVTNGGVVTLKTPSGDRRVTPIGIYADYGNEFGTAAVDQSVWKEWTGLERPINTSIFLKEGVDTNELRDALRLKFPGLDIRNARELREIALSIFDQTFRVTSALNGIGVTVAIAGLILGLFSIFVESSGTWRTLNRLGFRTRGFLATAGLEGLGISLSAWIGGTIVGIALGWLLIHVINVESFGWTLLWSLPLGTMGLFGLLLLAAGGLCGILTGAWWQRTSR